MRKTGFRGIARGVLVWLLIGAGITVGVAWGAALLEGSKWGSALNGTMDYRARMFVAPYPSTPPAGWEDDLNPSVYESDVVWARCRMWASASDIQYATGGHLATDRRVVQMRVGLPLPCLSWESWSEASGSRPFRPLNRSSWRTGVSLSTRKQWFGMSPWRLPLMPQVPELLIDAVFWGAVTWLISGGIRRWRGAWRRERGRCEKCGYDRKGLAVGAVCPECGSTPQDLVTSPP